MDDIVKMCMQRFLTDNDAQVILSAPSEHLKFQSLLESLKKFRLNVWIMICVTLHNTSLEHVSSQLMEGKCISVCGRQEIKHVKLIWRKCTMTTNKIDMMLYVSNT